MSSLWQVKSRKTCHIFFSIAFFWHLMTLHSSIYDVYLTCLSHLVPPNPTWLPTNSHKYSEFILSALYLSVAPKVGIEANVTQQEKGQNKHSRKKYQNVLLNPSSTPVAKRWREICLALSELECFLRPFCYSQRTIFDFQLLGSYKCGFCSSCFLLPLRHKRYFLHF